MRCKYVKLNEYFLLTVRDEDGGSEMLDSSCCLNVYQRGSSVKLALDKSIIT